MLFSEIRENFPKVNIISHTDLDGYGSAAIMCRFLKNLLGYSFTDISVHHVDYSDEYPLVDGFNIITDISVDRYSKNWARIKEHMNIPGNLIWWIDHHQSSVDELEVDPELKKIPHVVSSGASATYLCWKIYETMAFELLVHGKPLGMVENWLHTEPIVSNFGFSIFDFMREYTPGEFDVNPAWTPREAHWRLKTGILTPGAYKNPPATRRNTDEFYRGVPIAVRYTDDWDVFDLRFGESIYYNSAFVNGSIFPKSATHPYYSVFILPPYKIISGDSPEMERQKYATVGLLYYGRTALAFQNTSFINELLKSGYVIRFFPTIDFLQKHPEFRNLSKIEFICVNRRDTNVKIALPNFSDVYHWFITYGEKIDTITYSIYCQHNAFKQFTAKDLASVLGGGGHRGAAGFTYSHRLRDEIRTLPFNRNEKLIIITEPLDQAMIHLIKKDLEHWEEMLWSGNQPFDSDYVPNSCYEYRWWETVEDYRTGFHTLHEENSWFII